MAEYINNKTDIHDLISLLESRKNELFFYSPYSFLRNVSSDHIYELTIKNRILSKVKKGTIEPWHISTNNNEFVFLVEYLPWDTEYFELPTYKLVTVLFEEANKVFLPEATKIFKQQFFNQPKKYCFCDIPSEDIFVLQALTSEGFRLIETRMTYYLDLSKFENERFLVRNANTNDIENLRKIASEMRNPFDRVHADPAIDNQKADDFLATYIEESIKGFADATIVPNEPGIPPDAFVTAKFLKDEWEPLGINVSKMVLSAVSSETCKGWYKKLISEMAYLLKKEGAQYAFMHPASTNKAVIYSYENLGCRLGQVSHILSFAQH